MEHAFSIQRVSRIRRYIDFDCFQTKLSVIYLFVASQQAADDASESQEETPDTMALDETWSSTADTNQSSTNNQSTEPTNTSTTSPRAADDAITYIGGSQHRHARRVRLTHEFLRYLIVIANEPVNIIFIFIF